MKYAAVWQHTPASGQSVRVIAHPETLEDADTVQKAQDEGRVVLGNLPPAMKDEMTPLAVVELDEDMIEALDKCELYELDTGAEELMFVRVDDLTYWSAYPWWAK